jgi:hypothetical protein
MLQHTLDELTAKREQSSQMRQDLEHSHHCEALGVLPRLAPGRDHARTSYAGKPRIRHTRAQGLDELSAQVVARSFSSDQNE